MTLDNPLASNSAHLSPAEPDPAAPADDRPNAGPEPAADDSPAGPVPAELGPDQRHCRGDRNHSRRGLTARPGPGAP